MKSNVEKAKELLAELEKIEKEYSFSDAPVSTQSVGYLNPSFTSLKDKKKKKNKKEKYLL